jgi:hypothetical protein
MRVNPKRNTPHGDTEIRRDDPAAGRLQQEKHRNPLAALGARRGPDEIEGGPALLGVRERMERAGRERDQEAAEGQRVPGLREALSSVEAPGAGRGAREGARGGARLRAPRPVRRLLRAHPAQVRRLLGGVHRRPQQPPRRAAVPHLLGPPAVGRAGAGRGRRHGGLDLEVDRGAPREGAAGELRVLRLRRGKGGLLGRHDAGRPGAGGLPEVRLPAVRGALRGLRRLGAGVLAAGALQGEGRRDPAQARRVRRGVALHPVQLPEGARLGKAADALPAVLPGRAGLGRPAGAGRVRQVAGPWRTGEHPGPRGPRAEVRGRHPGGDGRGPRRHRLRRRLVARRGGHAGREGGAPQGRAPRGGPRQGRGARGALTEGAPGQGLLRRVGVPAPRGGVAPPRDPRPPTGGRRRQAAPRGFGARPGRGEGPPGLRAHPGRPASSRPTPSPCAPPTGRSRRR